MKTNSIKTVEVCIISIARLKSIMKVASIGVVFPYNEDLQTASYMKGFFSKVSGYIVTGFVKNWDEKFGMNDTFLKSEPLLRTIVNPPVRSIFVSKEIKEMIDAGKSFVLKSDTETVLKIKNEKGWSSIVRCLIDLSYVRDLEDKELMNEKSIQAFIGPGLSTQ